MPKTRRSQYRRLGERVTNLPHARNTPQLLCHGEDARIASAVHGDLQAVLIRAVTVLNEYPLQVQIGRFKYRLNRKQGGLSAVNKEDEEWWPLTASQKEPALNRL